jgi:plastocyanin
VHRTVRRRGRRRKELELRRHLRGTTAKVLALGLVSCVGVVAATGVATAGGGTEKHGTLGQTVVITAKGHGGNVHWAPSQNSVLPGDTVELRNKSGEPHTFSLVAQPDLPQSNSEIRHCFDSGICAQIAAAHGVVPPDFQIQQRRVDNGLHGLDTEFSSGNAKAGPQDGDSVIYNRHVKHWTVSSTGDETLYFMCAIHPWMQGQLDVGLTKK